MNYLNYIIYFNLIFILGITSKSNAKVLSLEEAQEIVLANNPDIGATEFRKEAAEARIPQAESLEDPMIGVEFYNTPIDSIDVTEADDIDFKVRQTILFPGKLSTRGKSARFDLTRISEEERAHVLDVLLDLKLTYYEIWRLDRLIEVNHENQKIIKNTIGVLETSYAVGKGSLDASLKAQIELTKLENEAIALNAERLTHLVHLKAIMNNEAHEAIELPKTIAVPKLSLTVDELKKKASEHRPELQSIRAQVDYDTSRITEAKQTLLPDFSFGLAYKEVPAGKNVWALEAMINVPVFFWRKNKAAIREAQANQKISEATKKSMSIHTIHDIEEAYNAVQSGRAQLTAYEKKILPQALSNLKASEIAYGAHKADFITYLDAFRMYNDLTISSVETKTNLIKSYARLERIVGKRLEEL